MRYSLSLVVLSTRLVLASQSSFNVHDDLLAFPQYQVVFSEDLMSESEVDTLLSASAQSAVPTSDSTELDSQSASSTASTSSQAHNTYETLILHDQPYLCSIPQITLPTKNESSAAEARLQEAKELSRATAKGWELLSDLEGTCLYFISGWWSYSFCYDKDVTQFHQLPMPPGHSGPPVRDPSTAMYVLGRLPPSSAPSDATLSEQDEFGNEISVRKPSPATQQPLQNEIQVKGDTRYLVQHFQGGTTCDLTGKPRKIEVQYHCNTQGNHDRIGWIKEVTTCSYVMVVYTHRLCSDAAFLPPKPVKANTIECKAIVPEDELRYWTDTKDLEASLLASHRNQNPPIPDAQSKPINVGGVIVGGQKLFGKEGNRLPLPANFISTTADSSDSKPATTEIVAKARPASEGGKVEVLDDERLESLDIDPKLIEDLRKELEKMSDGKGWQLEIVDGDGVTREIRGMIEEEGGGETRFVAEESDANTVKDDGSNDDDNEGSQETYKEEL